MAIRDEVLGQNPRLAAVFDSALIPPHEKVALLDRLFGGRVGDLTLSVLKVLAEKHRLGILRSIVTCVEQLWEERQGRVPVEVSFALAGRRGARGRADRQAAGDPRQGTRGERRARTRT